MSEKKKKTNQSNCFRYFFISITNLTGTLQEEDSSDELETEGEESEDTELTKTEEGDEVVGAEGEMDRVGESVAAVGRIEGLEEGFFKRRDPLFSLLDGRCPLR